MFAKIVQWSIAKTEGGEVPGPLTMRKTARLVPFPSLSNLFSERERERECVCACVCLDCPGSWARGGYSPVALEIS